MKTRFSQNVLRVFALLLPLCVAAPLPAQSGDDHYDTAIGLPQPMTVERVDREAGLVWFMGRAYQVSNGLSVSRPDVAAIRTGGRTLTISDLEPGMEVLVSTDATVPSAKHRPEILGMWRIE